MDPWVRFIISQAVAAIQVLVLDKTIKLTKKDIAMLDQAHNALGAILDAARSKK